MNKFGIGLAQGWLTRWFLTDRNHAFSFCDIIKRKLTSSRYKQMPYRSEENITTYNGALPNSQPQMKNHFINQPWAGSAFLSTEALLES